MKTKQIYSLLISLLFLLHFLNTQSQELKKEVQFTRHKFIPFYNLRKVGNTTIFQGNKEKNNYFEGWYFKMVSEDGKSILSVIPGISLSADGKDQHAFIQIINGVTAETRYFSFDMEEFSFSKKGFAIKIGDNYFSENMISLNLKDKDIVVTGKVEMTEQVNYTSGKLLNPGIMGWYRFVPFMQCYHGVVSLTHKLNGKLNINDNTLDFDLGKGYIEKDWGASMPSAWIWMQSNHFNEPNSSLMLSIADIPWMGKSFTGFLGFYYHNNKIYHFATYRRTRLHLKITDDDKVEIHIDNRKHRFLIETSSNNAGLLKAPTKGSMDRRIAESIDARLKITMFDKKGQILHTDSTFITGLEMVGDYKSLQGLLK